MDFSKRVAYEDTHTLNVVDPATDKPTGISIVIRSAFSEVGKQLLRKHSNSNIERRNRGKPMKAEQLEEQAIEKAASYVVSWDWGVDPETKEPNTYDGEVPVYSMKAAAKIMREQGWLFGQVVEAAEDIANFTKGSKKGSADE